MYIFIRSSLLSRIQLIAAFSARSPVPTILSIEFKRILQFFFRLINNILILIFYVDFGTLCWVMRMSAINECNNSVTAVQQLVLTNSATIPDDKLEMFYKWIRSQCQYLEKEQFPFVVTQANIPRRLSISTYNYFQSSISTLLSTYYVLSGIEYVRNSTAMFDEDATAIYCKLFLNPRSVVWIDFGFNIGKEFGGKHPAIILKNINNDVLIVAPVSTNVDNRHTASDTVITFSQRDVFNLPSLRDRFTNITRITPVSVYRLDVTSKVGSISKTKYQELIQKISNYYY